MDYIARLLWSMKFPREAYWSGQLQYPRDLPDPGVKPRSPTLEADALTSEPPGKPRDLQWPLAYILFLILLFFFKEPIGKSYFNSVW